jgi:hypothetical protein
MALWLLLNKPATNTALRFSLVQLNYVMTMYMSATLYVCAPM